MPTLAPTQTLRLDKFWQLLLSEQGAIFDSPIYRSIIEERAHFLLAQVESSHIVHLAQRRSKLIESKSAFLLAPIVSLKGGTDCFEETCHTAIVALEVGLGVTHESEWQGGACISERSFWVRTLSSASGTSSPIAVLVSGIRIDGSKARRRNHGIVVRYCT